MILIVINLGIPRGLAAGQIPSYLRETLSVIRKGSDAALTRVQVSGSELPPDIDTDGLANVVQDFSSNNFKVGIK